MFLVKNSPTYQDTISQIKTYLLPPHETEYLFMPDNHVELIINIGGPMKRRLVGSIRPVTIATGELFMTSCRSKGLTITGNDLYFISAKIPAQYTGMFFDEQNTDRDQLISLGKFPGIKNQTQFETYLKTWWKNLSPFEPDMMMDEALDIMRSSNGQIKVKEVNEQLGISKSYMEQRFNKEIGLSPKEFCKIEKLNHFLANYHQFRDSMTLTQLTFKSGYYDQSHLIKEFRYFMETRPREFVRMAGLTF